MLKFSKVVSNNDPFQHARIKVKNNGQWIKPINVFKFFKKEEIPQVGQIVELIEKENELYYGGK